jgi:sarcosine oxidase subunit alpha
MPRSGASIPVTLDGAGVAAFPGESVAGLLARLGHRATRRTLRGKAPRGYFCGMGACFECMVQIDGRDVQGCLTYVAPGMGIVTRLDLAQ